MWTMTLLKIVAGIRLLYLLCILLITLMQDRLLFPRWTSRPSQASFTRGSLSASFCGMKWTW